MAYKLQKIALFFILLSPFLILVFDVFNDNLIDPIEEITNPTGQWALRFVILSLLITPLVIIFKKSSLLRLRRMIGVFAFFYMCLHFVIFMIDKQFNPIEIITEITSTPYLVLGIIALFFSLLLAITSTASWIKRLGRKWKTLHTLNYAIIILAWLHLLLQSKSGWDTEIALYFGIIVMLFGVRILKPKKLI